MQSTNSKRVEVVYWSQQYSRGHRFFVRSTENSGGRGNPLLSTGANAFRTTNFRSRFAMRGAETHGNTRRDGPTRIPSIGRCWQGLRLRSVKDGALVWEDGHIRDVTNADVG